MPNTPVSAPGIVFFGYWSGLIALEHYPGPAMYFDLDVCFLTDLRTLCEDTLWACRWEQYDVCARLDIRVHATRLFDPLWDPSSLLYGDAERFFCTRDHLPVDLHALALERHLAIHWHIHRNAVPAPTSIYAGLPRACA